MNDYEYGSMDQQQGMMSSPDLYLRMMLPETFEPTPYSVIFGRGKKCTDSCGNRRLKVIVSLFIERYAKSRTKEEKSSIVSEIQATVQAACTDKRGAFIRYSNGRWFEVESLLAREKIGGILRDSLAERYRSSTRNKLAVRRKRRQERRRRSSTTSTESASSFLSSEDESSSSFMVPPPRVVPSSSNGMILFPQNYIHPIDIFGSKTTTWDAFIYYEE